MFFKTKFKNYSNIIDVIKFVDKEDNFNKALEVHREDDFIISDVVEIVKDDFGSLEYRAFVVNGEIYNISRIHDQLFCTIPDNVMKKLNSVVEKMAGTEFPKSYVVDLFVYQDSYDGQAVDVLEFNPIVASGTYLYNTVFERIADLNHSDPLNSIPTEIRKYGSLEECGYDVVSNTHRSICYNMPGGFAADIMSFNLLGTRSSGTSFFHIHTTSSDDVNLQGLTNLTEISSDGDMTDEAVFGGSVEEVTSIDDMIKMLNKKLENQIKGTK